MKYILLLFVLSSISIVSAAQEAKQEIKRDSLFIVTYTTGSTWDASKQPHEQQYFKEHSANLGTLRKNGTIMFGARHGEQGMIIISAESFEHATKLIQADVAVQHNLFNARIEKLKPFFYGCIEQAK